MPVYEYYCENCKQKFERMRPFSSSDESADCPKCSNKATRVISSCYSRSSSGQGESKSLAGGGCSSCSGGSCSSCGH